MSSKVESGEEHIPDGWKLVEIGALVAENLADLQTGPFGTMLLASEYKEEGTPVVAVKNIGDNKLIYADNDIPRVDEETRIRLLRYSLNEGDILFGRKGAVDRRALVSRDEVGWLQGSDCIRLRFFSSEIDPKYVSFYLGSPQHTEWILAHSVGSTMSSLNQSILSRISFLLPPLEEQRKIAAILSTWDEAIGLVEQLIAVLGRRKQALMQLLLTGAVRFAGFEGEWEEVELGEIAQINAEALTEKTNPDHKYYYVDLSAVDKGMITLPMEKIRFAELPSRARRILHYADVIMATVRPNLQGFAICNFDPTDIICSTGFALISPNDLRESQYIYQNLYSGSVTGQIQDLVTGSNYPAINSSDVKKLRIPYSKDVSEHIKVGDVLQACDSEIQLLGKMGDQLREQKRGLMQQLLTGAVRV